jgi:hypothetical protein
VPILMFDNGDGVENHNTHSCPSGETDIFQPILSKSVAMFIPHKGCRGVLQQIHD